MAVDLGTATTVTGGSSGAFSQMTQVDWGGVSREAVQTSAMDTATAHTHIPADLYDPGELSVDRLSDGSEASLVAAAAEVWTLAFGGTANTLVASGFVTSEEWGVPFEDVITQKLTIKLSGAIT